MTKSLNLASSFFALTFLLIYSAFVSGILKLSFALIAVASLLIVLATQNRARLSTRLVISLIVAVLCLTAALPLTANTLFLAASKYLTFLVGLGLITSLDGDAESKPDPKFYSDFSLILASLLVGVLICLVKFLVKGRYVTLIDETVYLFQGQNFFNLPKTFPESELKSILLRQEYVTRNGIAGQYPPGWPFFLYLSQLLGVRDCILGVCAGLCFYFTARLGKLLFNYPVGLFAGALLVTNSWFLEYAISFHSHIFAMCTLLASLTCLTISLKQNTKHKEFYLFLSGVAYGLLFATRPLTAVAAAPIICCGVLLAGAPNHGLSYLSFIWFMAGTMPGLLGVAIYNFILNNNPLLFGYDAAQNGLQKLGFGERGTVTYGPSGQTDKISQFFTAKDLAMGLARRLRDCTLDFLPWGIPLILFFQDRTVLPTYTKRTTLLTLALLISAPLFYSFYPFSSTRLVIEVLPLFSILSAALICLSRNLNKGLLIATLVLGQTIASGHRLISLKSNFEKRFLPSFENLESLSSKGENRTVYVRSFGKIEPLFEVLSAFPIINSSSMIKVKRYLPDDQNRSDGAIIWEDESVINTILLLED